MTSNIENTRINFLRLLFALLFVVALALDPVFLGTMPGMALETLGILTIIAGVLGRFWAIMYIGGRKTAEVVSDGPYSICRHPLYLFSTIATLGFGLMLQSLVFAVAVALGAFLVLDRTAASEEGRLRELFGPAWEDFAARTPRFLPRVSQFVTEPTVSVNISVLRRNLADALVFLGLIPIAQAINWWNGTGAFSLIRIF